MAFQADLYKLSDSDLNGELKSPILLATIYKQVMAKKVCGKRKLYKKITWRVKIARHAFENGIQLLHKNF